METDIQETIDTIKSFTGTGDGGSTMIGIDDEGVPIIVKKNSPFIALVGEIDSLSAEFGMLESSTARAYQLLLQEIMAMLYKNEIDIELLKKKTASIERYAKRYEYLLVPRFVISKGQWGVCRTFCRHTERLLVTYLEGAKVNGGKHLLRFFNRLSTFCFIKMYRLYYAEPDLGDV